MLCASPRKGAIDRVLGLSGRFISQFIFVTTDVVIDENVEVCGHSKSQRLSAHREIIQAPEWPSACFLCFFYLFVLTTSCAWRGEKLALDARGLGDMGLWPGLPASAKCIGSWVMWR